MNYYFTLNEIEVLKEHYYNLSSIAGMLGIFDDVMNEAENLHNSEDYKDEIDIILDNVSIIKEKIEIIENLAAAYDELIGKIGG